MNKFRVLLSLLIVGLLAAGFIAGCSSSGSGDGDGGGTETGSVSGTVTDTNGDPVSGATCTITTTDTKSLWLNLTDFNGFFNFRNIPVGIWPMTISKSGFQTLTIQVAVTSGSNTEIPPAETVVTPSTGTGNVSGVVSDSTTTAPIEGATVVIGAFSTTSSATGTYTLAGITPGLQTITAAKTGYESYTSTVTVVADTTVTKDIALTSSAPEPGKGHVKGKVIDENGNALSGVTVTTGSTTAITDSNGEYTLMNLTPGANTLSFAKTGYDNATVGVTVVADQTVTAATVTMSTGLTTGTTILCSVPRIAEIGVEDRAALGRPSNGGSVSDNGAYVAFVSSQPLLAIHISYTTHAYLFSRASGTVTMMDVDPNGLEGTKETQKIVITGASDTFISGDGSLIAYSTDASNILGPGIDSNGTYDVFVYHRTSGKNSRVSVDFTNPLIGGYINDARTTGGPSLNCGLSRDGGYVVFDSTAKNLVTTGLITDTAANHTTRNVFRVKLTQAADGTVTTSEPILISGRQKDGKECLPADWGTARTSLNPYISRDGRFVVYESNALPGTNYFYVGGQAEGSALITSGIVAGRNGFIAPYRDAGVDRDIILCNTQNSIQTRTTFISESATQKRQETGANQCTIPTVSDNGTKVAFQCQDALSVWVSGNDDKMDVWLKNLSDGSLTRVSDIGSGTRGDSRNPMVSRDGTLVAFDSAGTGFVQNDVNNSTDCFVYEIAYTSFTRVNLNTNNEQTESTGGVGSYGLFLSGDNNYVTFTSVAKNLVSNDYLRAGVQDVYLRKWQ